MSAPTASASTQSNAPAQHTQANATGRNGQAGGARRSGEAGADNSLFAHLLLLLGDAGEPPLAALNATAEGEPGKDDAALLEAEDAPTDNPLAAIAGWPGSPITAEAAQAAAKAREGAAANGRAGIEAPSATLQELKASEQTTELASAERAAEAGRELSTPLDPADRAAHEAPPAAGAARSNGANKGLSATAHAQALGQGIAATNSTRTAQANGAPGITAPDGSTLTWRRSPAPEGAPASATAHLATVRSTVTFNERFGQLAGAELNPAALRDTLGRSTGSASAGASALATGGVPGGATGADAALAAGGASGGDLSSAGHGSEGAGGESTSGGNETAGSTGAEADETAISHWGTQNLRQASLRVGQEGEAIDIQLSVKGQEVQVDFRTDDAQARQTLENSADGTLAELLQRSGIQLAGVSVGAHGQPGQGRPGANADAGSGRTNRIGDKGAATEPAPPTQPRVQPPRADGSRPLDLFV